MAEPDINSTPLALDDTIAAVSTPAGRGGIAVLRLSGNRCVAIARSLFRPAGSAPGAEWQLRPRHVTLGELVDPRAGTALDTACCTFFPAPHSYTGQDVIELSCHGSPKLLEMILAAAVSSGARPAAAGEFTYRAYLSGRIDVTRAEAVRDLIEAESEREVEAAAAQLRGDLATLVDRCRDALLPLVADAEAVLEFVDEAEHFPGREQLVERAAAVETSLRAAAASYRRGRRIREGIRVALLGRENVGKSTIFNSLVGSSRAIVTAEPGTTRDVIAETVEMEGARVRLLDTAGLREAGSEAERIGIAKGLEEAGAAEVILFVLDLTRPPSAAEQERLRAAAPGKTIVVRNKIDRLNGEPLPPAPIERPGVPVVAVSALRGDGMEALRRAIVEKAGCAATIPAREVIVTTVRHRRLLELAADRLAACRESAAGGATEEYLLEDLHGALRHLGELTGQVPIESIYDQIFSRFCIGK